jgi:hypothetical protein
MAALSQFGSTWVNEDLTPALACGWFSRSFHAKQKRSWGGIRVFRVLWLKMLASALSEGASPAPFRRQS